MTVLGQGVAAGPGSVVPLGDWGTASILQQSGSQFGSAKQPGYKSAVTALHVHLNAEHAGLPAGTDVVVGYVEAAAEAAPPAPAPKVETAPDEVRPKRARPKPRASEEQDDGDRRGASPPPVRPVPFDIIPRLTESGYVFPVYGQASFANTFAAPRGGSVGWHHGEDIFAPLGAPVLAVANGTVYSVGWNDIGGLRLWLQDTAGNEFYYAHLSAFSPLAVNGAQVRAGDVIGFVGNSGDAQGTPYHLHFEIHPLGMLSEGYDGVVAPYTYLMAWRRLSDIVFPDGAGWAPLPNAKATAPRPGAIVLQVSDISTASGLRPGSVARAFVAPAASEGDGALVRGFTPGAAPSVDSLERPGGRGD
jgi:murein DD-endopeptidase MepM/ murein hydrolase activator NlpD